MEIILLWPRRLKLPTSNPVQPSRANKILYNGVNILLCPSTTYFRLSLSFKRESFFAFINSLKVLSRALVSLSFFFPVRPKSTEYLSKAKEVN